MFPSIGLGLPTFDAADLSGIRRRIIRIAAVTVGLALLIAWAVLFWQAHKERHDTEHRGLAASAVAANAVEREMRALGYLLKGVSKSPLLQSGNLEAFHHQLLATPRPEGAWFILWDLDRQILNTTHPFGATLPRIDELPGTRERLEVVRAIGLSMSDRIRAPMFDRWAIAVSYRLDNPEGRMNRVLTLLIPEEHFNEAIQEAVGPAGWTTILLDRKLQWLATRSSQGETTPLPDLIPMLEGRSGNGLLTTGRGQQASLISFNRSPDTGYTTVSILPAAVANAPVRTALYYASAIAAILALVGAGAAQALLRNVDPIDSLKLTAAATRTELVETNKRLNEILESMSDCHFTINRSFRVTAVNSATVRWTGRRANEIVGRSCFDFAPSGSDCARALIQAVEHRTSYYGNITSELRPDRFIELRAFPTAEGAGVFFSDVTDRVIAHRTAIKERELLQASLDALTQQIAILDEDGRIIAVNQAWRRFIEGTGLGIPAYGIGARYLEIGVSEGGNFSGMKDVLNGLRPSFQALYRLSSEAERWLMMRAFRFKVADETRIIVSHEDVTELMYTRATVNELSGRLLTLQEEERQRIASELHDSTTQYLVAVGLNLMKVERLLPQQDGQRLLGEIDHLLEEALKELRLFTYLLHPASLDENGFGDTVQAFANGFSNRTGLQVTCRVADGMDDLPIDLQRALLRIVQEALSNVHRHAVASKVSIGLRLTPDEILLCIADDGQGMKVRSTAPRSGKPSLGVGIPGMRIRLYQFGGDLRIRSGHRGTALRGRIPREGWAADGSKAA